MKDHYVSQTYLRGFTNADGYLIPYYKSEYSVLGVPKLPKTVCYEIDGDSNKYFDNPRILDSYLPVFENPWKNNINALRNHVIDDKPIDFTLRRGVSLGLETFAVPKPEYIEVFNDLIIKAAEKRVFLNRIVLNWQS